MAQSVARRLHNPKVVNAIITGSMGCALHGPEGHLLALGKCGDALRTSSHVCAHKTACPSGLRGQTQVLLAQAAWVQIPLLSYRLGTLPRLFTHDVAGLSQT